MNRPSQEIQVWLLVVLAALATGAALDLFVYARSLAHAGVVTGLGLLAAAATWHTTQRPDLGAVAGALVALWPLPHTSSGTFLLAGFALGLVCLLPRDTLKPAPRLLSGVLALLLAAGTVFHLTANLTGAALGGLLAAVLAASRPTAPTQGTIRVAWRTGLFLPAGALAVLLVVNAATGRFAQPDGRAAVLWGLALLGLLVLLSLAVLGLATLLESTAPHQAALWIAASALVGMLAGVGLERSLDLLYTAIAVASVPITLLVAVAVSRGAHDADRLGGLVYAVPLLAVVLQLAV